MTGYICGPHRYKYQGLDIEYSGACGYYPLTKKGDMYIRWSKSVNQRYDEFMALSDAVKAAYHLGGGCVSI